MGLLSDVTSAVRGVGRLGAGVVREGADSVNSWVQAREDARRWETIDSDLEKAAKRAKARGGLHNMGSPEHAPAHDPKALAYDPFDVVGAMGYRERPTSFSYSAMAMVGHGVPVVADVVRVRKTQVGTFCQLPENRHAPGFRVRLRDWRNTTMTKAAEREAAMLEQVVLNTGFTHPHRPQSGTSLKEFAAQMVSDSLIFDQMNFEIVPNRKGTPSYLRPVDPATIRLLDPASVEPGGVYAVQQIDGAVVADFTPDELAFCVRNPRSGIRGYGYGLSELETLVREITGMLWGMDYNRKFFTQGAAVKGLLNFKGTVPDKQLKAFRRQWYAMVSGVSNAWKTPITNAEELQWINMQLTNRDMEYSAWMDFLIKIVCARYLIAPEEVNFSYGNTGQAAAMGGTSTEEKLKASKDLGLRPLVQWFFEALNRNFLQRLNPDFELIPVGLDEKGVQEETDLLTKQQSAFLTIDEARERVELPPLGDEKGGGLIMNPTYLQYIQGKEGMGEDEGDEGFEGEGSDTEDGESTASTENEPEDTGPQPFTIEDWDDEDDDEDDVDSQSETALKSEQGIVRFVAPLT